MKKLIILVVALTSLTACAPKVGSKEWCEDMKEKDKGNWTANESMNFAKHCIFNEPKD
ncbi:DUF3012 domain-containing protein [Alteromonas halophila]|uniref:DUF3012 domain-containing protein n=1 Tax=Alteromonas halophila TaxID=516698 RepID=A0A918N168_9ALTE|nr:DUF3012 domain-containing protein [Alteromonas halophila]GGW92380.1 hypothetical protein GCM10007391_28430 [Alteromonas halophila]